VKRKRPIDKSKSAAFFDAAADSDDDDASAGDWMHPRPPKVTGAIALEDRGSKRRRLKAEGVTLAEDGRFWEAMAKWNQALTLSQLRLDALGAHSPDDFEHPNDDDDSPRPRLPDYADTLLALFPEDARLDSELQEMKAQALMEVGEVFPAVQAAEAAAKTNPRWHVAWQTLGRTQLGFGDILSAVSSFEKALHLKPDDEEIRDVDLKWALELAEQKKVRDAELAAKLEAEREREGGESEEEHTSVGLDFIGGGHCGNCHKPIPKPNSPSPAP